MIKEVYKECRTGFISTFLCLLLNKNIQNLNKMVNIFKYTALKRRFPIQSAPKIISAELLQPLGNISSFELKIVQLNFL